MKKIFILIIFLINFNITANELNPSKFIEYIIEKTKPALIEKNTDILKKLMEENLDFNEIVMIIMGKNQWIKSSEKQKNKFLKELKNLMLKTYTKTVYYYIDSDITFLPIKHDNKNIENLKRIQLSTIMKKNNKNVNIIFRLIKNNENWLIFDIMIEGVSILKSLKTQYSEMIKIKGLDYTILKMKENNE